MESEESGAAEARSTGEVAQEFLRELLAAMYMAADVELGESREGTARLEIVGEDAGRLIGRNGDTLNALQYLTTLVTLKQTGEHTRLLLDADGYRDRREAALVELAHSLAEEVARIGQEAQLDPLGAYERRIIHNALLEHPDVVTYSEGEEPERCVVIAPRPQPQSE